MEHRTDLHEALSLSLASSHLHKRLHDPDHVLADAAAHDLLKALAACGFVVATVEPHPGAAD